MNENALEFIKSISNSEIQKKILELLSKKMSDEEILDELILCFGEVKK
jgi:hypothetical protein